MPGLNKQAVSKLCHERFPDWVIDYAREIRDHILLLPPYHIKGNSHGPRVRIRNGNEFHRMLRHEKIKATLGATGRYALQRDYDIMVMEMLAIGIDVDTIQIVDEQAFRAGAAYWRFEHARMPATIAQKCAARVRRRLEAKRNRALTRAENRQWKLCEN